MWHRLKIRNFRSIAKADVTLAPFTLVVGQNGSGKSNFADALVFLRDIAVDAEEAVRRRNGIEGVRRAGRTKPFDVGLVLSSAPTRDGLDPGAFHHELVLKSSRSESWGFDSELGWFRGTEKRRLTWQRRGQRCGFGATEVNELDESIEPTTSVLRAAIASFGRAQLADPRLTLRYRFSPEQMRVPQPFSASKILSEDGSNIASILAKQPLEPEALAAMRRIVPGLEGIQPETTARYQSLGFQQRTGRNGPTQSFAASEMSEGALRSLGIIVAATRMRTGQTLIIEEPEANIHPGAARVLFDVLKGASTKGTVLVTTHSPELLDEASAEEILVCELREGETHIGPLAHSQRHVIQTQLMTAGELMRSERLRIEGRRRQPVTADD